MPVPGPSPTRVQQLLRAQDRISFLYLERCVVHRDANAVTATDDRGTVHVPAAALGALLLGPGTRISHAAMMLVAESGTTCVWVGERGVRYYAHGRSLAGSTRLLLAQAEAVVNRTARLAVARRMYAMRFGDDDAAEAAEASMQQLRGREGARMRQVYRDASRSTGVPWNGRVYDPDDFGASDPVNQALSAAHTCLYGIVHAVVVALGCSPGLGFVHTGHERSFVYDVADLYKTEITIPVAFAVAARAATDADGPVDVAAATRRAVRDAVADGHLLQRCARDVRALLLPDDTTVDDAFTADVVELWDGADRTVAAGTSYGTDEGAPPW